MSHLKISVWNATLTPPLFQALVREFCPSLRDASSRTFPFTAMSSSPGTIPPADQQYAPSAGSQLQGTGYWNGTKPVRTECLSQHWPPTVLPDSIRCNYFLARHEINFFQVWLVCKWMRSNFKIQPLTLNQTELVQFFAFQRTIPLLLKSFYELHFLYKCQTTSFWKIFSKYKPSCLL